MMMTMGIYNCFIWWIQRHCSRDPFLCWLWKHATLLKIFKWTVIFLRYVQRVNFIIFANVLKQLCRAFYQIIVLIKISAKIIELTLLSVGWKTHTFPVYIWAVYLCIYICIYIYIYIYIYTSTLFRLTQISLAVVRFEKEDTLVVCVVSTFTLPGVFQVFTADLHLRDALYLNADKDHWCLTTNLLVVQNLSHSRCSICFQNMLEILKCMRKIILYNCLFQPNQIKASPLHTISEEIFHGNH